MAAYLRTITIGGLVKQILDDSILVINFSKFTRYNGVL